MLVICSHVCVEQVVKYVIVKIIDMSLLLATVILVQSLYDYIATIFKYNTYYLQRIVQGTAAAVPPPFRPSEPAFCGSCPVVTPYYCRLGDLLC